jgi:hypothetical protein
LLTDLICVERQTYKKSIEVCSKIMTPHELMSTCPEVWSDSSLWE